jgi:hypothetical protein
MTKLICFALFCAISTTAGAAEMNYSKPVRIAMTCFKDGEQVSGMNKICYYNCAGSQAAITVSSVSLCPLSIDR